MYRRWRIISIVFWILIWQLAAQLIDNSIFLVGPLQVAGTLIRSLPEPDFWLRIVHSWLRIAVGFTSALILGIFLGALSCRRIVIREFLGPAVQLMKSIPVASFVILTLIWMGSENLCIFISFLVVLPMIYVNTLAGLESTDPKLLEMADVFGVPFLRRIRFLYLPALLPYLVSGCRVALGMSIKSGVAAEVIGTPAWSIGKQLYLSKTWLDTSSLFAWTLVIIAVSAAFERLALFLLDRIPCGTPYKEEAK